MSVLRAILGRFARFLVRIARTLDPDLATAPYWVMPERMAALRLRYPGAPEHWLETLARHTTFADEAQFLPERGADPDVERTQFGKTDKSGRSPPARVDQGRPTGRPVVRVPRRARTEPTIVKFGAWTAATPPTSEKVAPRARPRRPVVKFAVASVRNPIANLLRSERAEPRAKPKFPSDGGVSVERRDESPQLDDIATPREHVTFFPNAPTQHAGRVEQSPALERDHEACGQRRELRWPSVHESRSIRPSWPGELTKPARPSAQFAAFDNRWPELPPLADDPPPLAPASDEAALRAEQIGGTWNA